MSSVHSQNPPVHNPEGQSVLLEHTAKLLLQYLAPETSPRHAINKLLQPGQSSPVVQGFAQVPLSSRTLPDGQAAHLPSTQLPLLHWWLWLHFLSAGLGLAQAMPGMEASTPPTRVAPINLSALPRERLPLASPLASSSKERLDVSWLTWSPFPRRAGLED